MVSPSDDRAMSQTVIGLGLCPRMLVGFLNPPLVRVELMTSTLVFSRDGPAGGLIWCEMS